MGGEIVMLGCPQLSALPTTPGSAAGFAGPAASDSKRSGMHMMCISWLYR